MIFDKFCAVVERHFPEFESLAREAKVFVFDKPAHTIKPGDTKQEDFELFTLPFPCTVIEDPGTAVMLIDTEDNQTGLHGKRFFIDVVPMYSNSEAFTDCDPYDNELKKEYRRAIGVDESGITISFGVIYWGEPEDHRIITKGITTRVMAASKDEVFFDRDLVHGDYADTYKKIATKAGIGNTISAMEELISIYTNRHFVLETLPLRLKAHPKKIPRTHQRPTYTILDARTIRAKMGTLDAHEKALEEGRKRNSPIPHERRRHPRRLSAAGGHYKEDKVIIIPACWIGESEKKVGNKIYKVRLDI